MVVFIVVVVFVVMVVVFVVVVVVFVVVVEGFVAILLLSLMFFVGDDVDSGCVGKSYAAQMNDTRI